MVASNLLDRALSPLDSAFTPELVNRLLAVAPDPTTQDRIEALAEGANEGLLTPEERSEYESLIAAATMIALLHRRARAAVQARGTP